MKLMEGFQHIPTLNHQAFLIEQNYFQKMKIPVLVLGYPEYQERYPQNHLLGSDPQLKARNSDQKAQMVHQSFQQ